MSKKWRSTPEYAQSRSDRFWPGLAAGTEGGRDNAGDVPGVVDDE
jgi:hypothetical protein